MRSPWITAGLGVALAALGCSTPENGFGDDTDDVDHDGWTIEDGDCDDRDASVHPDAEEVCDGVDTDCDGSIPQDEITDGDADGWALCMDCDEGDAGVNPGADEICDGVDNDCDPATDEGLDGDGDGYTICDEDCDDTDDVLHPGDEDGDGASPCEGDCDDEDETRTIDDADGDGHSSCEGDCDDEDATLNLMDEDEDGYSTCTGDCDDEDATLNPDQEEIAGDGIDSDCDGEDDS